jgi:hypothetical protein
MKNILKLSAVAVTAFFMVACGGGSSSDSNPQATVGQVQLTGAASASATLPAPDRLSAQAFPAPAGGCAGCSPTNVGADVQQLWLGESVDCTDAVKIADKGATGGYSDLTSNPTLFDTEVDPGTYHCLIFKMKDIIRFKPNDAAETNFPGVCDQTQTYSHDIFKANAGESWYDPETGSTVLSDGTFDTALAESIVQSVFVYFVTDYDANLPFSNDDPSASARTANPDIHGHQILPLSNPLVVVAGETSQGLFYADFDNQIYVDNATYCTLEAPDVGFKLP